MTMFGKIKAREINQLVHPLKERKFPSCHRVRPQPAEAALETLSVLTQLRRSWLSWDQLVEAFAFKDNGQILESSNARARSVLRKFFF